MISALSGFGLSGGSTNYFLANNTNYLRRRSPPAIPPLRSPATPQRHDFDHPIDDRVLVRRLGHQRYECDGALPRHGQPNQQTGSSVLSVLTATAVVPGGASANVMFSATGATTGTVVLGANMSVNSLTFNEATPRTIGSDGNTLTLLSTGVGSSSAISANQNATINANLALGAAQTWTTASSSQLTVGGQVGGAFGLTLAGAGTVVLTGANSYTGGTTLSGGTLAINASDASPASSPISSGTLHAGQRRDDRQHLGQSRDVAFDPQHPGLER